MLDWTASQPPVTHGGQPLTLALFDLDNTLLAGDSDHAWGQFLVEEGIVDAEEYRKF